MNDIQSFLMRLGIPTYMMSIYAVSTNKITFNMPKQMPNQIGWIYGLSTYVDGVTPDNQTLPTTSQAEDLYIVLKAGQTEFIASMRLTDLVYSPSAGNDITYMPINIPAKISLDQSAFQNPLLTSGYTIQLNLFYIDLSSVETLLQEGIMGVNGQLLRTI